MPTTTEPTSPANIGGADQINPLQQMLLARLSGDADQTGGTSMPDLVEQALGDNPLAVPLAAAMRKRQEQRTAGLDEAAEENTEDPVVADVLRRLYDEVEELRARAVLLADATGACPRCWGEDVSCSRCRGRGRPGGRSPNPSLFESFVVPAVRRRRFDVNCAGR